MNWRDRGIYCPPVGTPETLIVGEAPNRRMYEQDVQFDDALCIPRLFSMCGMDEESFKASFIRTNLHREWPGRDPGGVGDLYLEHEAKVGVESIREFLDDYPFCFLVVLLGRRVERSFLGHSNVRRDFFVEHLAEIEHHGRKSIKCIVVPHPSGTSGWWNEPGNQEKATRFWKRQGIEARHTTYCEHCFYNSRSIDVESGRFPCGMPVVGDSTFRSVFIKHMAESPSKSHAWGFNAGVCLCGWRP